MNEKVCIIGIGNNGKDCYKRLCGKYSEIYLYDNDRRKWNHDVFGNRIISIE